IKLYTKAHNMRSDHANAGLLKLLYYFVGGFRTKPKTLPIMINHFVISGVRISSPKNIKPSLIKAALPTIYTHLEV
ncbi:hypothetical protein ACWIUA_10845, partial [Ursidibacter sp. B-7004-1]